MKTLLALFILTLSASSFATVSITVCRDLSAKEKKSFNKQACDAVRRVYYTTKVDMKLCEEQTDLNLCSNKENGDYLVGKLQYSETREAMDCNFSVTDSKIATLDCSDE